MNPHFAPTVPVSDAVLARLRSVCADVDVDEAPRDTAGRDWWPISATWATDGEVPGRPAVVVRPTSTDEVSAVLASANAAGVAVTPFAGRSGVCGGSVPVFGGISMDLRGLAGIEAVDDTSLLAAVRPGTYGDRYEQELRDVYGVTCGHWPQSMAISTVGGWLACRGAGQYSTRYGKIEDMVTGLEVVLADGRVVRTGHHGPRAATGPDLTQLFVGSEGTLGVITSAQLRVWPLPPAERRSAWGFDDFAAGLDACRRILRRGATPAVLRLYDEVESGRHFDIDGRCVLVVVDEGDPVLVDAVETAVRTECHGSAILSLDLCERWLAHRNEVPSLDGLAAAGIVADTVEVAAPWAALPGIYDRALDALRAIDATLAASAHQSHAYPDGACLYFTFAGQPPGEDRDGYYAQAWDAVIATTLAGGGALSHHHGVGLNRARHMAAALGSGFAVLQSVKDALDPQGILNPGKLGLRSPFGAAPWPPPPGAHR